MGEEVTVRDSGADEPVAPLIVGGSHVDSWWRFLCPCGDGESTEAAFVRVYRALINDLLPGFGHPRRVLLWGAAGRVDLSDLPASDVERARLLSDSVPADLIPEAALYLNVYLQTASGHHEVWGRFVTVSLEPDDLGRGIFLAVDMEDTVYRPPKAGASQDEWRQFGYNGPRLVTFLRSLKTELGAVFVGRSSTETGPEGYIDPGSDQTGLPSP